MSAIRMSFLRYRREYLSQALRQAPVQPCKTPQKITEPLPTDKLPPLRGTLSPGEGIRGANHQLDKLEHLSLDNSAIIKGKGSDPMAVRLNEDKEMVQKIKEGLKRTGGYCPCRLQRTEENKCICKEFRGQIADPDFKGYCHCLLYYKD